MFLRNKRAARRVKTGCVAEDDHKRWFECFKLYTLLQRKLPRSEETSYLFQIDTFDNVELHAICLKLKPKKIQKKILCRAQMS